MHLPSAETNAIKKKEERDDRLRKRASSRVARLKVEESLALDRASLIQGTKDLQGKGRSNFRQTYIDHCLWKH